MVVKEIMFGKRDKKIAKSARKKVKRFKKNLKGFGNIEDFDVEDKPFGEL